MLAGILVRGFVSVSVPASGFAYDPDQDGDGDDRDDYQDEQGNYGDGQDTSSPRGCRGRRVCSPDGLNITPYRRVPRDRLLGLGPAQSAALDEPGEVAQVLCEVTLRVGEDVRHGLAHGAAGRIGVVHRYVDARARRRDLLEADLAARHDLPVHGVPADAAVRVHLGGPCVELHALAQGSLDPPVAGVLAGHPDLFDVGHEAREILEIGPVTVDVLDRGFYLDALVDSLRHGRPF